MNPRICYLCKNPLSYDDYVGTNLSIEEFIVYTKIVESQRLCKVVFKKAFKHHELVKYWISPEIELACCHCRRFLDKLIKNKETLWTMLEWADNKKIKILKELGILSQKDLQKLKEKK